MPDYALVNIVCIPQGHGRGAACHALKYGIVLSVRGDFTLSYKKI